MSSAASAINQNEQDLTTETNESSSASQQSIHSTDVSVPILPGQILTEENHEDNLMERIDELIQDFLSRHNRHRPYNTTTRWTVDHAPHLIYRVTMIINELTELI